MDDLMPPKLLAQRVARLADEADDVEEILAAREEEWGVSASLVQRARLDLGLAAKAATLAAEAYPDTPGRWGGYCLTRTGVKFYPLDPRPEEVEPEDIAHALAARNRFSGMTSRAYSVGAHTLRVAAMARVIARKVRENDLLSGCKLSVEKVYAYALLHDAAEAYLADIPRPIKGYLPGWDAIEMRVTRAVWARFGLDEMPYDVSLLVQSADDYALAIEANELMVEPGSVWSTLTLPSDPEVFEAGALGTWIGKADVKAALLREMEALTPVAQDVVMVEVAPPAVPEGRSGWMGELHTAQEDERVERNRRRLRAD